MAIITVRADPLPNDATLVMHFGKGDARSVSQLVGNVRRGHDYWQGAFDDYGRFAISGYCVDGNESARLIAAMPHGEYGTASIGSLIAEGFGVLPTSVRLERVFPSDEFQDWHVSMMLRIPPIERDLRSNDDRWEELQSAVVTEVAALMRMFEPRVSKVAR